MEIERREFDNFMKKFKKGEYGNQRLGQAFYDHFKLDKSNADFKGLYEKDGNHAVALIRHLFTLG